MKSAKAKAKPIPDGYHSVTPYLIVKNASAAIEFYKKGLGAKEIMRFGKPGDKIGHAEIEINGSRIMLADEHQEMGAKSPEAYGGSPITIHLYVNDVDQLVKQAAAAGAKIERAPEDMFYGDRTATLADPHGHKWHVSTHIEDLTIDEVHQRAAEAYSRKK